MAQSQQNISPRLILSLLGILCYVSGFVSGLGMHQLEDCAYVVPKYTLLVANEAI